MASREDDLLAGKSPGGVSQAQAAFLRLSRARNERFEAADELSAVDRFAAGFAGGAAEGQTFGHRELIPGSLSREDEALTNREGWDAHDLGRLGGELLGAMPTAIVTGGLAQLGTRALGRGMLPYAPKIAENLLRLSRAAEPIHASRVNEVLLSGARNVWEGMAFTAASAPLYKLEDGQSRVRTIATQFGLGTAIDFALGAFLHVPGSRIEKVVEHLAGSDNDIDRQVADGISRALKDIDEGRYTPFEAPRGVPEFDALRANVAQGMTEAQVARGGESAEELLRREVSDQGGLLRQDVAGAARDIGVDRRLPPGPPEFQPARFRGGPEAFDLEARKLGAEVQDATPPDIAGLLPAETGGPRLARGETDPAAALRREDVSVERNRPFLSRMAPEEATPAPAGRAGVDLPEEEAALLAQEAPEPTPVAPPREAAVEAPAAPERVAPEDELAAPAAPKVRSSTVRDVLTRIEQAETEADVFTAAADLAGMKGAEAQAALEFAQAKMATLRGANGAGGPRPDAPFDAEAPAAEPLAEGIRTPEQSIAHYQERIAELEGPMNKLRAELKQGTDRVARPERENSRRVLQNLERDVERYNRFISVFEEQRRAAAPPPNKGTPERIKTAERIRTLREERRALKNDPLTGIGTPAAFQHARERIDADPTQEWASFDVRGLKTSNDLVGAAEGDALLRRVGEAVRSVAEEMDIPARNLFRAGGDEFGVAVPKGRAEEFARAVQAAVGESKIADTEFVSGVRYGTADTWYDAAAAAQAAKKLETGPRGRGPDPQILRSSVGEEVRPETVPAPDAEVAAPLRDAGFTKHPQPIKSRATTARPMEEHVEAITRLTDVSEAADNSADLRVAALRRREAELREVGDTYGHDVEDHLRARYGMKPRDLEPTLAEQATTRRHADSAARAYTAGERVEGVDGASTSIETPSGPLEARYRLIELDELQASHNPDSWQANPDYFPEGAVQQRDYFRNPGNRESVVEIATKPSARQFLDHSFFAQTGPPVVTPDGKAVAGNGRSMALKLMGRQNPKGYAAYRTELEGAAQGFGLDPAQIQGMKNPVLVREIVDSSVDVGNVDQMRELNIAFDQSVGKAKTSSEDAASRVSRLESRGSDATRHMESTLDAETTLREWLWGKDGKEFVKLLRQGDIITTTEANEFIDPKSGFLTDAGRDMVEEMLMVRAVGDAGAVQRAPASIRNTIEHAIPGIIRSQGHEAWDVSNTVREALELHSSLAGNPNYPGRKGKVAAFRGQGSLLGEEVSPRALDIAQVMEDWSKRDVTEAFRSFFREMDIAAKQGQSDDLFGFTPKTPEKAFDEVFGAARRAEKGGAGCQ